MSRSKVRCAIYTRKSTSAGLEQAFNSIDLQREACEQYIRSQTAQGWAIVSTRYDDGGFTGANMERPAFARLVSDMAEKKIDIVVVYKVDRLSRSLLDFAQVMEYFNRAEVAFVSVTQNFSTADAMGRLTLNMLMSFAEFEREMIAERTRDKMRAARRKGKWTGGNVPFGYDVVDKRLVVNAVEAKTVKKVFRLFEAHRSLATVARMLNDEEIANRGGKAWTRPAIQHLIKSPIYAGLQRSGDELHKGEHKCKRQPKSATVEWGVFDACREVRHL